jgi:hypothetical protein
MRAVLVKSAVVAAALAVVLVPEAQAAGGRAVGSCSSGTFSGSFTVTYDTVGTVHRLQVARVALGPYIGNSGTLKLRATHINATGVERQVYSRTWSGVPSGQRTYTLPDDVSIPSADIGYVTATFSSGGLGCTAKATIR